jgi:hypothetical protein
MVEPVAEFIEFFCKGSNTDVKVKIFSDIT